MSLSDDGGVICDFCQTATDVQCKQLCIFEVPEGNVALIVIWNQAWIGSCRCHFSVISMLIAVNCQQQIIVIFVCLLLSKHEKDEENQLMFVLTRKLITNQTESSANATFYNVVKRV